MRSDVITEISPNEASSRLLLSIGARGNAAVIRGLVSGWRAARTWPDALAERWGASRLDPAYIHGASPAQPNVAAFRDMVRASATPIYLSDFPLRKIGDDIAQDLEPFPHHLLPRCYTSCFGKFLRLFWCNAGGATPLHFDRHGTHNLFFQVVGRKSFWLICRDHRAECYLANWKWSLVADAAQADFVRYPKFRDVPVHALTLEAGDVLYMPPYTLHQAKAVTPSISLNLDWHTRVSSVRAMLATFSGMPLGNFRHNFKTALLAGGLPAELLFPRPYVD